MISSWDHNPVMRSPQLIYEDQLVHCFCAGLAGFTSLQLRFWLRTNLCTWSRRFGGAWQNRICSFKNSTSFRDGLKSMVPHFFDEYPKISCLTFTRVPGFGPIAICCPASRVCSFWGLNTSNLFYTVRCYYLWIIQILWAHIQYIEQHIFYTILYYTCW